MGDNVLILGAGFSFNAGVPLLGGFVEKMLDYAIRKSCNGQSLDSNYIEIFESAIKIRNDLDCYHVRAAFDDRNLEDILSILSFDTLNASQEGRKKLIAMNKAIASTIELGCSVKPMDVQVGGVRAFETSGPQLYRDFWKALFAWAAQRKDLPTIITFNYDLVLERSLVQEVTREITFEEKSKFPFDKFVVHYHYLPVVDPAYQLEFVSYLEDVTPKQRYTIKPIDMSSVKGNTLEIDILKLHGSLNFHSQKQAKDTPDDFQFPVLDPYILPPVFNKMSSDSPGSMWAYALDHLRTAKNIVIVGYSLPQTDIYMQYFLKAGLGTMRLSLRSKSSLRQATSLAKPSRGPRRL